MIVLEAHVRTDKAKTKIGVKSLVEPNPFKIYDAGIYALDAFGELCDEMNDSYVQADVVWDIREPKA